MSNQEKKLKPQRKHIISRMIIASSNIVRKGIYIIITDEHYKFSPVYSNEQTK